MAKISRDQTEVNARIVYWGIEGAGKTTNLRAVHGKLRPDHRGEIREVPTRLDPSVSYELVPIELGEIAGVRTRIQLVSPPGAREQAPTRKQLLDQVDGIVLVVDSQSGRADENLACVQELRVALAAYGRSLEDVPLVVQYNKCDLADPLAIEDLHRKLDLEGVPVFECTASEESGVLQTLSTISKRVIRSLREHAPAGAAEPPPAAEAAAEPAPAPPHPAKPEAAERDPAPGPRPAERMEEALLAEARGEPDAALDESVLEAQTLLDRPWDELGGEIERPRGAHLGAGLSIVSVGEAVRVGKRAVRLPLVLGDDEGQTSSVALTLSLEPLLDESSD